MADLESDKTLVEHANRCWEAEVENANRIASRVQAVATATLVLLGLGLFKFDWVLSKDSLPAVRWVWAEWLIRFCLVGSIVCFGRALTVLFPQGRGHKTASYLLSFKPSDEERSGHEAALRRTYKAYRNLQIRNGLKWVILKRGEKWFGLGVILVLSALIMYLLCSTTPRMPTENADGKPTATTTSTGSGNPTDAIGH